MTTDSEKQHFESSFCKKLPINEYSFIITILLKNMLLNKTKVQHTL